MSDTTVRAKNPCQSALLTTITAWMLFSSCGSFMFANCGVGAQIDRNCTVRGTGDATCSFTNTGWSPGSTCVRVGIQRTVDGARLGMTIARSGRLDVNDSEVASVSILEGSTSPTEFCGGTLATPWTANCTVVVEPVGG